MCGITGKIYFGNNIVSEQDILAMNEKIQHRGPDDDGVYISPDQKVGLGHKRLSIIDLSLLGHQPMGYLDRYWIVFNGEIYNFQEKQEMLQKNGYAFSSKTDTEVIMALYDKFGKKCLEHLRGMFSFAIYDEKGKTIFCARDRVGKKPFKYYLDSNVFIFASELKAILTQKEYHKEPDYTAIHHYLTLQYCPAPLTGFKDIKKLEPAHYLFIDLKTNKTERKRYWRLDYSQKLDLSEDEWKKRIIEKLEESVKLRMISDVPLGAFLSGGIDSSAVVAMMSKFSKNPVKTFSIGFEEEKFNELPYARMIAKKFKTDHTEFIVKPKATDILPMLARQYEEPYADSSSLPVYYLSRLTRNHVTVALNGDGGDENFAGYSRYSAFRFSLLCEKILLLPEIAYLPLSKLSERIFKNTLSERISRFLKTLSSDYKHRYPAYTSYFLNEQKDQLYSRRFRDNLIQENTYDIIAEKFDQSKTEDKMDQALYADFSTYLPEDLLAKVDIATMSVALEGRSPFLDHTLLELTAKIPFSLKLRGLNNKKYILKESLRGIIPDEVMFRRKMGFIAPLEIWFKNDLYGYAKNKLLSKEASIGKIFQKAYIANLIENHKKTNINYANHIWSLLLLELWFEEYFN
jgi:asparagine synthase (glutamine-hydrolysing)